MIGLGLLKSWRLWAGLGVVLALAATAALVVHQSRAIGGLEAEVVTKQATIHEMGNRLTSQERQHERELSARNQAIAAERAHARQAKDRAATLAQQINNARDADGDVDACMGMALPAGIADSLRQ